VGDGLDSTGATRAAGPVWPHPAIAAWHRLNSELGRFGLQVALVEAIKGEPRASIYRLRFEGRPPIIAKRAATAAAAPERTVYEELLPQLPVTRPAYLGSVEMAESTWLFLDDVGDVRFSPGDEEHVKAVSRWLGTMHGSSIPRVTAVSLPPRTASGYLRHLENARSSIVCALGDSRRNAANRKALVATLGQLETLLPIWPALDAASARMPASLLHGDYRPKNVRLKKTRAGLEVYPIDWETAGVGPAAVDLARVSIEPYMEAIRPYCPGLGLNELRDAQSAGQVIRWLAAIDWVSARLAEGWPEKVLAGVEVCAGELSAAARVLRSRLVD
jgi:hypothetical protein